MEDFKNLHSVRVIWRGNKYVVEMDPDASLKNLGDELQKLTNVTPDTLRLVVPQVSGKGSKLLSPYSEEHSNLSLREASVVEGKSIRMMGASEDEVEKFQQDAKDRLRIAGFDEEERRMRLRMAPRSSSWVKLPQGPYTFGGFRALQLPGIELNPPALEALKRMHMLAADPGIVAIMNKHRWSVGIMTEMAPVGYVGVSPKCVLGFNKNCGEEISLRLRTDDLKGFRKYESIKRTLLHELAHMVFSEHDENFFALDKQLNQEAASLDWTKSKGHTLGVVRNLDYDEEDYDASDKNYFLQKLGGNSSDQLGSARETSVAAAYRRLTGMYEANSGVHGEPDPDDSRSALETRLDEMDPLSGRIQLSKTFDEPDPDDLESKQIKSTDKNIHLLDHNNFLVSEIMEDGVSDVNKEQNSEESETKRVVKAEPDPDDVMATLEISGMKIDESVALDEPDPDDSHENRVARNEFVPEPENYLMGSQVTANMTIDEPDPDDEELKRIQDPVSVICNRLKKAVEMLRTEANPAEDSTALQTLFKIIRNVIEHPNETKFKRLRKANPLIQKNVAKYKVAMEILQMIGFVEEAVLDGTGTRETYIVLKRNDPGLLWLAKSCLEGSTAC